MADSKGKAAPRGTARRGDGYRRYAPRRKVCAFCADKNLVIDYKDPTKLRRFLSDRAKIEPRRKTGTCARHQRTLTTALKRARYLAMLPLTSEHIRWSGGVGVRSAEERRSRRDDRRREAPPMTAPVETAGVAPAESPVAAVVPTVAESAALAVEQDSTASSEKVGEAEITKEDE